MSDFDNYARHFPAGMKVGVGIPLSTAGVFRDWAIIHEIEEDFISLQLSRDQLPVNVSLHIGQIIDLRGGRDDAGYNCRAIVVAEGKAREILLRLIGEIVTDELREFYRIEAFVPIKYYISPLQNIDKLRQEWEQRREQRQIIEAGRKAREWDSRLLLVSAELPPERRLETSAERGEESEQPEEYDEWDTIMPLAANISGGGVRLTIHQHFENDVYVLLEMLVPEPRHIVDAVARVINSTPNLAAGGDGEYFNTSLQFVCIDERDRDAIIKHIANVQLKRIRLLREQFVFRDGTPAGDDDQGESSWLNWAFIAKWTGSVLIFLLITFLLVNYFKNYAKEHPKNEIEEMFEGGIKRYLDKFH